MYFIINNFFSFVFFFNPNLKTTFCCHFWGKTAWSNWKIFIVNKFKV